MERKTKQRILGILVMVGLVVILLPFFQSGKELPIETTSIKAPPFPDQPIEAAAVLPEQQPQLNQNTNEPSRVENIQTAENDIDQPDDTINTLRPNLNEPIPQPAIHKINNDNNANSSSANEDEQIKSSDTVKLTNAAPKLDSSKTKDKFAPQTNPIKKILPKLLSKKNKPITGPIEEDGLSRLTNDAWVIQIGSFTNKANALRLVNQLRAGGYQAFIQQVSTTFGSSTRVFVGPEKQHDSARELANQLENDMHIKGIIISYKPLAL